MIIHNGLHRMVTLKESVFYYITTMNENYEHPDMPEAVEAGILKGLYRFKKSEKPASKQRVQLLGSGTILREVIEAAKLLEKDFDVAADIWSAPSFNLLGRDGLEADRWNRLHPLETPKVPYITSCLAETAGPVIAATDYIKQYAEQVRAFIPRAYIVLGTDGFGRSDTRQQLRRFFEVDRYYIAVSALKALADEGLIAKELVVKAMQQYQINPDKPNPLSV